MLALLWLVLLASLALTSRSQTALGELTFLKIAAPELDAGFGRNRPRYKKADLEKSLGSFNFLSSIGGVAFGSTAETNVHWEILGLLYEEKQSDGQRLQVRVRERGSGRGQTVKLSIPDWQLVPIARFAESSEFSCFTYFGELSNREEEKKVLAREGHILNYHSAFTDTLLGLRLMQLDLLLLYPDSAQIVSQNGRVLLGAGEKAPAVRENERHLHAVQTFLRTQEERGNKFRSYVICDQGPVEWSVAKGRLSLSGDPVWHCWRYKPGIAEHFRELQEEVNTYANGQLRRELESGATTFDQRQSRFGELFDEEASRRIIQPMPDLTRELSARIREEKGINPLVYNAAVNTMRFAAFFRLVKRECPSEWERFARSLREVELRPQAETPTVLDLPAKYRRGLVIPASE